MTRVPDASYRPYFCCSRGDLALFNRAAEGDGGQPRHRDYEVSQEPDNLVLDSMGLDSPRIGSARLEGTSSFIGARCRGALFSVSQRWSNAITVLLMFGRGWMQRPHGAPTHAQGPFGWAGPACQTLAGGRAAWKALTKDPPPANYFPDTLQRQFWGWNSARSPSYRGRGMKPLQASWVLD